MKDLYETSNQKPTAQIDTIGWLFAAFVVVVAAIAAMVAYNANDTTASNAVSHVAGRAG